jgi:hypothetical protein
MRPLCLIAALAFLTLTFSGLGYAQKTEELNQPAKPMTAQSIRLQELARELSVARKAGDVLRTREIENQMIDLLPNIPAQPPSIMPSPEQASRLDAPITAPMWGNDVKVYSGSIRYGSRREIALDADTSGNLYLAVNGIAYDTGSAVEVFRSTDNGLAWSLVQGFVYSKSIVQSIDMCVTDTLAGHWLISIAWVAQPRVADLGGSLYWGSFLEDGSHWRYNLIAGATAGTSYRNPSICTDGKYYLPPVTYHYVAAEYITPSTGDSRGLYINTTHNWGSTWSLPDTSIRGIKEGTPTIAVDWSSNPDSLLVSFTRTFSATDMDIRIGRNSLDYTGISWSLRQVTTGAELEYDPSFAVDPLTGAGIVTYTCNRNNSGDLNALYAYSTNRFATFTMDSIATSASANEELTAVCQGQHSSGSAFRVVYRSSVSGGQILYKFIAGTLTGFYPVSPTVVSQYQPSGIIVPAISAVKDPVLITLGDVAYAGYGPVNVWFDGLNINVGIDRDKNGLPTEFVLAQNYPNPFNPRTTITYGLPVMSQVRLTVYNLLGQTVATLVDENKPAGVHTVQFDATSLSSGVYLYRLEAGTFAATKKLIVLK